MVMMKTYGFDYETNDPELKDRGVSWVYGLGEVIVTGLYDAQTKQKKSIDGDGGKTVRNLLVSPSVTLVGARIQYDLGWGCYVNRLKAADIKATLVDIAIAESLIDENQRFSLDDLARKYLKERKGHEVLQDIAKQHGMAGDFRGHLKRLWALGYQQDIRDYVISDADQPVRIWEQQKLILEELGLMEVFWREMRIDKITLGMKQRGVRIDYAKWQENCQIVKEPYDRLTREFETGYNVRLENSTTKFKTKDRRDIEASGKLIVNFNSPKTMAAMMDKFDVPYKHKITFKGWQPDGRKFNKDDWFQGDDVWTMRKRLKAHFPNVRVAKGKIILMVAKQYAERTALQAQNMGYEITNNPSINKFFFKATAATYKIVSDVMELKQAGNIITKFLGPNFERFLVKDEFGDWRLHGDFNVVGARQTGRMSASKPNLQNIPSKTVLFEGTDHEINLAKLCREVFLPERGHLGLKLDFNGQENRLQANFAVGIGGKLIRKMYNENPRLDEHQFVADASGLQDKHGKKNGRKYAKNVRFGLGYGMQTATMCEQFGWDKEFAEDLTEKVKAASPWVPDTMQYIQDMLLGHGDFEAGGPKEHLQKDYIKTLSGRRIHMAHDQRRSAYKFYNYLIQGSAADMLKACVDRMAERGLTEDEAISLLLLLVHDEAFLSIPINEKTVDTILTLQDIMQTACTLMVPVVCDPEAGTDWWNTEGQKTNEDTKALEETVQQMVKRVLADIGKPGKARIVDKTRQMEDAKDDDLDEDDEETDEEEYVDVEEF